MRRSSSRTDHAKKEGLLEGDHRVIAVHWRQTHPAMLVGNGLVKMLLIGRWLIRKTLNSRRRKIVNRVRGKRQLNYQTGKRQSVYPLGGTWGRMRGKN